MALSWSGETVELKDLIDYSRRFRIGLIAVTADADSTLGARRRRRAAAAAGARGLPAQSRADHLDSLMQLALGDALAIALLESRGFTALDFRGFHPGGRLGAMLKFVRDVMHTGDDVPLAPLGTRDVGGDRRDDGQGLRLRRHHRSTAASSSGIITDGDLRRHMRPDLLDAQGRRRDDAEAEDRRAPISSSARRSSCSTLEDHRVIVVEAGKPVGIVHLHDLLRAGVA